MLSFESKGDFSKSFNFLKKLNSLFDNVDLDSYGQKGVNALQNHAPKDTGLMASSWGYTIKKTKKSCTISWTNSDIENRCNVAILVQYGHATKNGSYVTGIDFVNPAMKPIFDDIANEIWKEANRA